jgi:hypothetical protein
MLSSYLHDQDPTVAAKKHPMILPRESSVVIYAVSQKHLAGEETPPVQDFCATYAVLSKQRESHVRISPSVGTLHRQGAAVIDKTAVEIACYYQFTAGVGSGFGYQELSVFIILPFSLLLFKRQDGTRSNIPKYSRLSIRSHHESSHSSDQTPLQVYIPAPQGDSSPLGPNQPPTGPLSHPHSYCQS